MNDAELPMSLIAQMQPLVVIRSFCGEVTAYMPEIPTIPDGSHCLKFTRAEGFGTVDYDKIRPFTTPATGTGLVDVVLALEERLHTRVLVHSKAPYNAALARQSLAAEWWPEEEIQ